MQANFRSCTSSDLGALMAHRWDKAVFLLATQVGIHPGNLSRQLREREPMRPEVAQRLPGLLGEDGALELLGEAENNP